MEDGDARSGGVEEVGGGMANGAFIAEYDASAGSCPPDASLLQEIVSLERTVFPEVLSRGKSLEQELSKQTTGLMYAVALAPGGGRARGEVIGYVLYSWVSSVRAFITELAVKENWRRQGHGEALLKAAIEKSRTRKIQRVALHVDPLRTAAVSLYQKCGFQVDELIEGYYSPGQHAYRMYLDFND